MSQSFSGQVCLVTGGGSGIGLATARRLLECGAKHVIIASRKEDRLEAAVKALNSSAASYVVMNIRELASVEKALEEVLAKHGQLDCLVNNGGGQFASPASHISPKGWRAVVDTNLNGSWFVTSTAFKLTKPQRKGGRPLSVVNVIVDNFTGFPGMVHTGAARAGVENFTKTLAREWGPLGFRINCVAPGIILSSGLDNYPEEMRPQFVRAGESTPLRRGGSESEVASAIIFLLSREASFITGATLRVDGGGSLQKAEFFPQAKTLCPVPSFHFTETEQSEFNSRRALSKL